MRYAIAFPILVLAASLVAAPQDPSPKKKDSPKAASKKAKSKKKAEAAPAEEQAPKDSAVGQLDEKYKNDLVEKPAQRYFRFEFKQHPSIRVGKWLRADFRLKFFHDFRSFDPEVTGDEGELENLRKFRVGVQGYITKNFEYQVEREIRNEIGDAFNLRYRPTMALWRDVYGNFRYFRKFQIRAGQFKIPFGLDQLHDGTDEFVYRSMIGNYLAPGRDLGIMAHGKLFESKVAYQAGIFRNDGWKAHDKDHERTGERTFAGRVVAPVFSLFDTPRFLKPFKDLELGAAFTESPVTEGLRSLRGRSWIITHNWFDRVNVRGHRLRLGAELNWQPGPFSVKGEVIRVRDERLKQSVREEDLPDVIARGWYFTTAWVVTGEKSAGGVVPRRDFIRGRGFGALQIAARYEQMRFGSSEHPGLPSRSSRAANIFAESERIASFGANWYLNRFTKVQFTALREVIEDPARAPITGIDTYWSRFLRVQFSF